MIAPTLIQPTQQSLAQAPPSQADLERKQAMVEAWKAYRGDFADPLKIAKDQPNDNVKANRCGPIVDKGVSFLFGQVLQLEAESEQEEASENVPGAQDVPPPAPTKAKKKPSPAQAFIDGLWGDDDDKMTTLAHLGINGGVCGQPFVKLIPAKFTQKFPRLVTLDPLLVRVVTAPDDCTCVLAYIIEYPGTAEWQKKQIIARVDMSGIASEMGEQDVQDTWTIANYMRRGQMGNWMQAGAIEAWPWSFAPIFSCQNLPNPNEYWGRPDLSADLILMNKVLAFIESTTSRIIKYHGHPITWASGTRMEDINISVDGVICLPDPSSKLEKLAAMDHFDGLLAFAEVIRQTMDEQSRVPSVALGRLESLPRGNISGVALQLLFQPLMEKTTQKQRLYGRMIRDISRAALVMAGLIPEEQYEDYDIDLHWQNLLPVDDLMAAQTAEIWKRIGVSGRTLIIDAGFDPDEEAKQLATEQAAQPQPPMTMQQQPQQQPPQSPFIGRQQGGPPQ